MGASLFLKFCFSSAQLCLKKKLNEIKASCLCFSWLVHICVPTDPPILIFSSSAQMNIMNNTETDSLAKLSKIWCKSRSGSQTRPVPNQNIDTATCHGGLQPHLPFPFLFSFKLVLNEIKLKFEWNSWKRWIHTWLPKVPRFYFLCKYLLPLEPITW